MKADRRIVGSTYYQSDHDLAAQQNIYQGTKHEPIVYYMRLDRLIKIGKTTDLRRRASSVTPQGVVAIERGGSGIEERRHLQFAAIRSHYEWFWLTPALADHIAEVRATFEAQQGITTEQWLMAHRVYPAHTYNVRPTHA